MIAVIVAGRVGEDELRRGVGDEGPQGVDEDRIGNEPAVEEIEEARRGVEEPGGRLRLAAAAGREQARRSRTAAGAICGDGEGQGVATGGEGRKRAEHEDLDVVGMRTDGEDVHAARPSRNSAIIAAVHVKRPPPQGSPLCGS